MNCLNMTENSSFACFVCRRDCTSWPLILPTGRASASRFSEVNLSERHYGSTVNCLNVTENTLFARFVCRKDCAPKNILRISTPKMPKNAYSFKENQGWHGLNQVVFFLKKTNWFFWVFSPS